MMFRAFSREQDFEATVRIWQECGWIDDGETDKAGLRSFLSGVFGVVAAPRGEVEALASVREAALQYEDRSLPAALVASVNVGRVARGRGLGGRVCAMAIAEAAHRGAAVIHLGMFDQGYYDKLGFGSGPPHRFMGVRPEDLLVKVPGAMPVRLGPDDAERCHANRLQRMRLHGAPSFPHVSATRSEMLWASKGFGLGFEDAEGNLTHHVYLRAKGENGPYRVAWMAYRSYAELHDLLGLIKSLQDQVYLVKMNELPGVQLQDLVRKPIAHLVQSRGSDFEQRSTSFAWYQARILNLAACIGAVSVYGPPIRFRLQLFDPISRRIPERAPWRGLSGQYDVTLAETSTVGPAEDDALPVLSASVGALTRLWLGVLSASGLTASDQLAGSPELIAALDRQLRPPRPIVDWEL